LIIYSAPARATAPAWKETLGCLSVDERVRVGSGLSQADYLKGSARGNPGSFEGIDTLPLLFRYIGPPVVVAAEHGLLP
jgi:hypothetical protein